MPRTIMALVVLITLFSAASLTAVAETDVATMDAIYVPVGRLVLAAPVGVVAQRPAVPFPHSRHFGYTCTTCHHTWNGHLPVQSCTASKCHDQPAPPAAKTRWLDYGSDSIRYYKYAFHKQCISCHKDIKRRNLKLERSRKTLRQPLQKTGPTGCVGCHSRS